ncbi:MAG: hypothetical protein ACK5NK_16820 [Niabella sp.]
MKKVVFIITLFLLFQLANAQQKIDIEKIEGQYGPATSGICLFKDGMFIIYGYATIIPGNYTINKNVLNFKPYKPGTFNMYGYYNPELKDSLRVNFRNFENGNNYVTFNTDSTRPVFNKSANCFTSPYLHTQKGKLQTIALFTRSITDSYSQNINEDWYFNIEKPYNDLIVIYNQPLYEIDSLIGTVTIEKGKTMLKLFSSYDEDILEKQNIANIGDNWKDVLDLKETIMQQRKDSNYLFANNDYKTFPSPKLENYQYDSLKNEYIKIADTEFINEYYDDRKLKKYIRLMPQQISNGKALQPATKPLFYRVCND